MIQADTEYTKINSQADLPADDTHYRYKVGKLLPDGRFLPYHEEQSSYGVKMKYGSREITHFARVPKLKSPTF